MSPRGYWNQSTYRELFGHYRSVLDGLIPAHVMNIGALLASVLPTMLATTRKPTEHDFVYVACVFFVCRIMVEYAFRRDKTQDGGHFHTNNLYWQSMDYWISAASKMTTPLGHLMEGEYEAKWKPMKRFLREHSNYRNDEVDALHFRAYAHAHQEVEQEYGATRSDHVVMPHTPPFNIVPCPCFTATTLFKVNETGFLQHLHGITSSMVFRHKGNKRGRTIQLHIGQDPDRWLSACVCGAHSDVKPFPARGGENWTCVGNMSTNTTNWRPRPRKVTVVKVADDDPNPDSDTDDELFADDDIKLAIRKRKTNTDDSDNEEVNTLPKVVQTRQDTLPSRQAREAEEAKQSRLNSQEVRKPWIDAESGSDQ